ncbi:MAG: ATP synthase F1 subunit delta [Myxococcota bacterium]
MSQEAVARRYARALFDLAREKKRIREVVGSVRAYADAYTNSSEFQALETDPNVADDDRVAVVTMLGSRLDADALVVRTVALLAERQRLSVLPDLATTLDDMADDSLGIVRAHVTSARTLSAGYKAKLVRKLEATTSKKVVVTYDVDETLIGGLTTQIDDRLIDGSLRGRLSQLADSLRQH